MVTLKNALRPTCLSTPFASRFLQTPQAFTAYYKLSLIAGYPHFWDSFNSTPFVDRKTLSLRGRLAPASSSRGVIFLSRFPKLG